MKELKMTLKILFLILIFSMVVRTTLFTAIISYWPDFSYYADHLCAMAMFIAMTLVCIIQFKLGRRKFALILGNKTNMHEIALSMAVAVLVLMLTFGESAVFTFAVAQYDAEAAYRLGKFHAEAYESYPFFSIRIVIFILFAVILPAIAEEFFFRGLVFRSLNKNHSFFLSAVFTAALFTSVHFSNTNYMGVFIFSLILSYLYATTRSLRSCMIAHATFNFLAFTNQHYFDFHRIRSINELDQLHDWIPQLAMLGVSLIAFGWLIVRSKDSIKHAALRQLPAVK